MLYRMPDTNSIGSNRAYNDGNIQDRIIPGFIFRTQLGGSYSDNDAAPITEHISIDRTDTFICGEDFDVTAGDNPALNADEIVSLIEQHRQYLVPAYRIRNDYYNGRHLAILNRAQFSKHRDDFRNIINLPKKLIDSFTGYASGIAPKIQYNPDDDDSDDDENVDSTVSSATPDNADQSANQKEQIQGVIADFLTNNDFDNVNSSIYRTSALQGRSYLYVWTTSQNSNDPTSNKTLHFKSFEPTNAFIVYAKGLTETVPQFGIIYYVNNNQITGKLVTPSKVYNFSYGTLGADQYFKNLDKSDDAPTTSPFTNIFDEGYSQEFLDENDNPILPLIEKNQDDNCAGMVDGAFSNFDAIDEIVSTKTNENQYFNNAYMSIIGPDVDGKTLNEMAANHVFNIRTPEGYTGTASVGFLSPEQNDESEEHQITRLISEAYEMSSIVNLNDPSMGETASGQALDRKLQPMMLIASDQESRMRVVYRQLFKMFFYVAHLNDSSIPLDGYTDMDYQFHQNKPHNLTDEVTAAKGMVGLTSTETMLSTISTVKDVSKEMKMIQQDKIRDAKFGQQFVTSDSDDPNETDTPDTPDDDQPDKTDDDPKNDDPTNSEG